MRQARSPRHELYLAINYIDHTKTNTKSPQTNGICERFHKTVLQEFYQVAFHTHFIGDLLIVRLQGVLTAAEQQLVKSLEANRGRDLLKQVRIHLIETARPFLEDMVEEVTGIRPLSLHHDISTATGEEVVIFILGVSPVVRDTKKKGGR